VPAIAPTVRVIARTRIWAGFVHWAKILGPGVVTGAADDDPSGITTYSIAGATAGYSMLWTALVTAPMMAVLMGICTRIGIVTGEGLAASMKRRFPKILVVGMIALTIAANTLNIAADYAGMGATAHLIVPWPPEAWILLFGAVMLVVQVFFSYTAFAWVVKVLCLSLLAYVATAFIVHPPWPHVLLATVVPQVRWNAAWIVTLLGVLGTTITPYLFFWQASMYLEEARRGRPVEIVDAHADINSGMIFSNSITFFIIVTTATTLGAHNLPVTTAQEAAIALRPLVGDHAALLFMFGIVGTGLLAIPVMAGASAYAVADYFGLEDSLTDKPRNAPVFYGIVAVGLILGLLMALLRLDAIKMLFYSAVFNGVAVVPLIYFVIRLGCTTAVLGRWVASTSARVIAWLTFWLMLVATLAIAPSFFGVR
jgi:NRAMP (natural resistance-associated macrophage protein)-like metal ion transporter